ncbi:conserved hypothetical protein [Photobacterium profundum SS9]|uniref:DUF2986 domain-containing protein n=2 Tax=Photobacterium profundum TaxID=74109 RepID=Q6LHX5_PHOPR|nr:conserved hypothetical protein [Photobacterium profundum SS9]
MCKYLFEEECEILLVIRLRAYTICALKFVRYEPLECDRQNTMNRKKKLNQILKKRLKQANVKLQTSNKPRYISKADRAKMDLEAAQQTSEGVAAEAQAVDTASADEIAKEPETK